MAEIGIPVLVLVLWVVVPWWLSRWWKDRRYEAEAARFWEKEAADLERELKVAALGHRVLDERLRQRLAAFEARDPQRFARALASAGIAELNPLPDGGLGERPAA